MTLQTATDTLITHCHSTVYGSYVVTRDRAPVFVTVDRDVLFETLEAIGFSEAGKYRVMIVSAEDFSDPDDITCFVWEAMVLKHADGQLPADLDDWDNRIGYDIGFVRAGFGDLDDELFTERKKRSAALAARDSRASAWLAGEQPFPIAAE